jgi:myo-inositol-1(or 4)-monophosphatase
LLRARWESPIEVRYKGAVDLVTDADRDAEALVIEALRRAFPDHGIVAEESTPQPGASSYRWYVDPLDGTTNFAHRYPYFAVSLALLRDSEIVLGVVYDPLRDELFLAERDRGATLNGAPIHVSDTRVLDRALLATGFPYDRREHPGFYLGFSERFLARSQDIRRSGSAALDLCYVGCGRLDGFWEWKLHPWDTAAGSLIVREGGGTVSDFRGAAHRLGGEQTLASNGHVHAEMVDVLTGLLPGSHA